MKAIRFISVIAAVLCGFLVTLTPAAAHNVQGNASYPLQEDIYTPAPNLFTGSFQYSIPIETPKGRGGVEPKLALSYDSSSGNGSLGTGWDLNLGAIERSLKKGVDYNADNYVLRLNGAAVELFLNSGATDFREKYQTAFYRITKVFDSGSSGPFSWVVTDKKGTNYYFGKGSTDRQINPLNSGIFGWRLDSVVDSNGNTMMVSYTADQGQLYPTKIQYTTYTNINGTNLSLFAPYEVDFIFDGWNCPSGTTCNAPGAPISYRAGYPIITAKRLKTIQISGLSTAGGSLSPIRAYTLTYAHNPSTNLDQLATVQQFGKDAVIDAAGNVSGPSAMPPISLTYKSAGNPLSSATPFSGVTSGVSGNGFMGGDFNGDGIGDLILPISGGALQPWAICLGTGQTVSCPPAPTSVPDYQAGVLAGAPFAIGNYNGDGLSWMLWIYQNVLYECGYHPDIKGTSFECFTPTDTATGTTLSITGGTTGVQVGDFNGDGKADLYIFNNATLTGQFCFSNSNNSTVVASFTCTNANAGFITGPVWDSSARMPITFVADVDGDRAMDLIDVTNGKVCYSNGSSAANFSLTCIDAPTTGTNVVAGDFNGDGLTDVALVGSTSASVCLSKGNARAFDVCSPLTLSGLAADGISQNLIVGDFNGDGRTDLMGRATTSTQAWSYCLSTGGNANFNCPSTTTNMTSSANMAGDFSGDGTTDAWSFSGAVNFDSLYSGQLTDIYNGIGARIHVDYLSSNNHYADPSSPHPSQLPFPVRVVQQVLVCDQWNASSGTCPSGRDALTKYDYYGGYYYIPNSEFRGFAMVAVTTPAGPNTEMTTETTYFNQGNANNNPSTSLNVADAYLAGRPWQKTVADNVVSGLVPSATQVTTSYTYPVGMAAPPYFNPPNLISTATSYGGVSTFITQEGLAYDGYGNTASITEYGDTSMYSDGGARLTAKTYATGSSSSWMVGLPASEIVYSGTAVNGANELSETDYFYGNASTCVSTLNQAPNPGDKLQRVSRKLLSNGTTADVLIGHDTVGNVLCSMDPNGNTTNYAYDTNATFLLTTTNPVNQVTTNQYYGVSNVTADNGYIGQLKSVTDPNGTSSKVYDALGRISQEYSPLAPLSAGVPAVAYAYPSAAQYGVVYTQNISRTVTGDYSNGAANQVYQGYFDGFGRVIRDVQQPNTLSSASANVVHDKVFDVRGHLYMESLPYYAGSAVYNTTYNRDGFGRAKQTLFADNSQSLYCTNGKVSVDVGRFSTQSTPNALGHTKRSTVDGLGRLIMVEEYNPSSTITSCDLTEANLTSATTHYAYDASDHLTTVTDSNSNVTSMTYDSLGRKIAMSDPDMGSWSFVYDLNGNMTQQTDAKGQIIYFHYDALNRLSQKDYGSPGSGDVVLYYDDYSKIGP